MTEPSTPVTFPQDRICPYGPPPAYDAFGSDRPLARAALYDGRVVWLVSGHGLARTLLTDPRLSSDRRRPGYPVIAPRFAAILDSTSALVGVDDPEHRGQRSMVLGDFTHRRAVESRPYIQRVVDERIDAMLAQGPPADLVRDFALPVPSMVICTLLGVPYADHAFFEEQSGRLLRSPEATELLAARDRLMAYLGDLIDRKAAEPPGDGLLDTLAHRWMNSGELSREEAVDIAFALLIGGHETTANMISLGTFTLLGQPDRLAELRADPELWPAAVEELLRLLSIVDFMLRVAVEDIDVDGTTIKAGEAVLVATSVVNRDESVFADPGILDPHRSSRHHLAFGFGIHQCLGQHLARTELEIALRTLVDRLPGLRLAAPAEEIPFKSGDTVQGMVELPVTW